MMNSKDKTYVCCHSPSLALLLYNTAFGDHDQKGLLLGRVETHIVTSTTDENEAIEEEKTVIYIEHCVQVPKEIFGPYGETDKEALKKWYELHRNYVVGWYSFRRNRKSTRCSFREHMIHKSLLRALEIPSADFFVVGLLSATTHVNRSTHAFNHVFFRMNRRLTFEPLRFKVYSLSDKLTNSSGYLKNIAFPVADTFQKITNSQIDEGNAAVSVQKIHEAANESLRSLTHELLHWEDNRIKLQNEVDELRKRLLPPPQPPHVFDFEPPEIEKIELTARLIKFNPDKDYNEGKIENMMVVSDAEVDSEEENRTPEDAGRRGNRQLRLSQPSGAGEPSSFWSRMDSASPLGGLNDIYSIKEPDSENLWLRMVPPKETSNSMNEFPSTSSTGEHLRVLTDELLQSPEVLNRTSKQPINMTFASVTKKKPTLASDLVMPNFSGGYKPSNGAANPNIMHTPDAVVQKTTFVNRSEPGHSRATDVPTAIAGTSSANREIGANFPPADMPSTSNPAGMQQPRVNVSATGISTMYPAEPKSGEGTPSDQTVHTSMEH